LSKEEITASYDDIVAFSELGEYIDMPVKHYSSGMYMRLGFSVAIHVKPDILIVDEILAVGDQPFQTKCFDRIYEMNRQGTTIIMVSHNLSIMRKLCSHLIWLENGRMREAGPTEIVAAQYLASSYEREGKQLADRTAVQTITRRGSGEMEITAVRFLNADEEETNSFLSGEAMTIEMDYIAHSPINEPEFGFSIFRQDGIHVTGPNNLLSGFKTGVVEGVGTIQYCIEKLPLLPALYHVTAAIHNSRSNHAYDVHDRAYSFRVNPGGTEEMFGLIELPAQWRLKPVEAIKLSQDLLEL
jgi:energy-coupling factor transporter ATP-binding protein EcfA2